MTEDVLTLAIDQGGHASRALAFDRAGSVLADARAEIDTQRPRDGWVEHDAEAMIESVREAVASVVSTLGARAARIRSAGLATQRSSIVCWDRRTGAALSPVLSWQDTRASEWLAGLSAHAGEVHARTGLPLSAHYGASKIRWCLEHLPAVAGALAAGRLAIGPLAGFLVYRLLDEHPLLVDPCNASRTLLCDLETGDWSDAQLALFGVPRAVLPAVMPNLHRYGHIQLGKCAVPLEVCTGDQSAAVFARGAPSPTTVSINAGTGAFALAATGERVIRAPGLLTGILCSGDGASSHAIEGTVNGAASALRLVAEQLELDFGVVTERLDDWCRAHSSPPLFLNGVSGLGSPYWVSDFPSAFVGGGDPTSRMVGVLESIVFLLQRNLEAMMSVGVRAREIVLTGGLAELDEFSRRLAALSGLPVRRPVVREATAAGLAFLLEGGVAESGDAPDVLPASPDAALTARYSHWREQLRARIDAAAH